LSLLIFFFPQLLFFAASLHCRFIRWWIGWTFLACSLLTSIIDLFTIPSPRVHVINFQRVPPPEHELSLHYARTVEKAHQLCRNGAKQLLARRRSPSLPRAMTPWRQPHRLLSDALLLPSHSNCSSSWAAQALAALFLPTK